MKTLLFFNAMGGGGKTTLVQHVAWMCAEQGIRVLVADLDPQLFLTAKFLDDDQIAARLDPNGPITVGRSLSAILEGMSHDVEPAIVEIGDRLGLLPGDPGLSLLEDSLSSSWSGLGTYHRLSTVAVADIVRGAGRRWGADLLLIDLGPNFGALNRAAAIAADYLIVPTAPGPLVSRGLENLGTKLDNWRSQWQQKRDIWLEYDDDLPAEAIWPIGYVVTRLVSWRGQPPKSTKPWMEQIPIAYRRTIAPAAPLPPPGEPDPCCLALLKDYRTLVTYAEEARKPMFHLTPADGAMGSHQAAVRQCYAEFLELVRRISAATGVKLPRG